MERWSQKMNMGKQWSRGDLMSRSDYTGLRTKRLLASWIKAVKTYRYLVTYTMLLSYLQGCWRNGHQSHVFELRRSGHQSQGADTFQFVKSLSILENTGRAGTGLWRWKDLSRLGYCQSNCVNCWHCKCTIMCLFQDVEVQSKVRTNTVHYIWNINNCTVKISRSN